MYRSFAENRRAYDRLDERYIKTESAIEKRWINQQMDILNDQSSCIENQVSLVRAKSTPGAVFQLLLISDLLNQIKDLLKEEEDAPTEKQALGRDLCRKIEGCLYSAVGVFESGTKDSDLEECRERFMPSCCDPHEIARKALAAA